METLLLQDPAYVQERYHALEVSQRERGSSSRLLQREPKETVAPLMDAVRHQINRYMTLGLEWAPSVVEKRVLVTQAILAELMARMDTELAAASQRLNDGSDSGENDSSEYGDDQANGRAHATPSCSETLEAQALEEDGSGGVSTPLPINELPPGTQLGLRLFFRMCQTLRDASRLQPNARLLTLVASKVPSILASLPPFPLSPGVVDVSFHSRGQAGRVASPSSTQPPASLSVFDELLHIFASLLESSNSDAKSQATVANEQNVSPLLSESDRAIILGAFVALSIKWGRLRDLLRAVNLLVQNNHLTAQISLDQLQPLLTELASATADSTPFTMPPQEAPHGFLVSFGKGDHGKLGHGQCSHAACSEGNCTENKCVPTIIDTIRSVQIVRIDSLSTHSLAITDKGELMAWGNGDKYRLGHGTTVKEYAPRIIDSLSLKGKVTDVACGLGHTIALMGNGEMYAWGNGSNGRLGLGDTNDRVGPTLVPFADEKTHTVGVAARTGAGARQIQRIYCGASHSLAVSSTGRAFAWGKNNQGQCGLGHTDDQLNVAEISYFSDECDDRIIHAAGGWEHTLFCGASGRAYSCGCGYKDSRRTGIPPVLGHGDCEKRLVPTPIQMFVDGNEEIVKVACGWDHSLAVSSRGTVYTWGSGSNGKLGHGDEQNCDVPTIVQRLREVPVKDVKAGCEHTVVLTNQHEVWTFGQGDSGRLGHGDSVTQKLPTLVEYFSQAGLRPVAIAVGDKYNLILVDEKPTTSTHSQNRCLSQDRTAQQPSSIKIAPSVLNNRRLHSHQEELKKKIFGSSSSSANVNMSCHTQREQYHTNELPLDSHGFHQDNNLERRYTPQCSSELALFLMHHIERLGCESYPCDLELANNVVSGEQHTLLAPFGVDKSRETLRGILDVMRAQEKTLDQLPEQVPCEYASLVKQRVCILISSLRILSTNIWGWKPQRSSHSKICPLIRGSTHVKHPSEQHNVDELLRQLHTIVNSFAESPTREPVLKFIGVAPKHLGNDLDTLFTTIQCEASRALMVGFEQFYPFKRGRRALMWELLQMIGSIDKSPRAVALASKLCEDSIMSEFVLHYVTTNTTRSKRHECCEKSEDKSEGFSQGIMLSSGCVSGVVDECDANHLVTLLTRLLKGCVEEANERLDKQVDCNGESRTSLSLKVLGVIQSHCFCVLANFQRNFERPTSIETPNSHICSCVIDVLLTFLKILFRESFALAKRLHKSTCSNLDMAGNGLRGTLMDSILPTAVNALNAVVASEVLRMMQDSDRRHLKNVDPDVPHIFRFVECLLPLSLRTVSVLDELSGVWDPTNMVDNQSREHDTSPRLNNWIDELGTAYSVLCGRLATVLVAYSERWIMHGGSEERAPKCLRNVIVRECVSMGVGNPTRDILLWEASGVVDGDCNLSSTEAGHHAAIPASRFEAKTEQDGRRLLLSFLDDLSSMDNLEIDFDQKTCIPDLDEPASLPTRTLLQCSFAVIAWNTNCASFMSNGSVPDVVRTNPAWIECLATYQLAISMLPNLRDHLDRELNCIAENAKVLLQFQPQHFGNEKSRNKWVKAMILFLLTPRDARALARSHVNDTICDDLLRIGLGVFHSLLKAVSSSGIRSAILSELGTVSRSRSLFEHSIDQTNNPTCIPHSSRILQTIENIIVCLVRIIEEDSSVAVKMKGIVLLIWPVRYRQYGAQSICEIFAKAGVVPVLTDFMLRRSSPVCPNEIRCIQKVDCARCPGMSPGDLQSTTGNRVSSALPGKLRMVEVTLLQDPPHEALQKTAFGVFCAVLRQFAKSGCPTLTKQHPLLVDRNLLSTIREIGTPRPSQGSPRRRLTLPRKPRALSLQDTFDLVYESAYHILQRPPYGAELHEEPLDCMQSETTVEAREEYQQDSYRGRLIYLYGSPLSISTSKTEVLWPLKPSDSLSSKYSDTLDGAYTLMWWMHVVQQRNFHAHPIQRPGTSLFVIGAPVGVSTTGSNLSTSDTRGLTVFIARDNCDVDGAIKIGIILSDGHSETRDAANTVAHQSVFYLNAACAGEWVHVGLVLAVGKNPIAFVNNAKISDSTILVPETGYSFSSRTSLTCGGSISPQLQSTIEEEAADVVSNPADKPGSSLEVIVDDFVIVNSAVCDLDIARRVQQGPVFLQIKQEHFSSTQCCDTLALVSLLTASYNAKKVEYQAASVSEHTLSTRWIQLLIRLLKAPGYSSTARVYIVELLRQVLPQSSEPSRETLIDIISWMIDEDGSIRGSNTLTDSPRQNRVLDVRAAYLHTHANPISRRDQMSLQPSTSPHPVFALLSSKGYFNNMEVAGSRARLGNAKTIPLSIAYHESQSVVISVIISLLRQLRRTPHWAAIVNAWMIDAAQQPMPIPRLTEGGTIDRLHPITASTVAACLVLGGYSEEYVNQCKVLLLCRSPELHKLKSMQLDDIGECLSSRVTIYADDECDAAATLIQRVIGGEEIRRYCWGKHQSLPIPGYELNKEKSADHDTLVRARLQIFVLRCLLLQLRQSSKKTFWRYVCLNDRTMFSALQHISATSSKRTIRERLGTDANKALQLPVVQRLLGAVYVLKQEGFNGHRLRLPRLHSLSWSAWSVYAHQAQLQQFETEPNATSLPSMLPWWQQGHTSRSSVLTVLGGDVEIRDLTVHAIRYFPTVTLNKVNGIVANSGLWFYEVTVLSDGLMQIGYVDGEFVSDPLQGQGVGDNINSWAFDGFRCKKWNVSSNDYGDSWRSGDVVGVLLDMDRMELSYFLNGKFLGVAFTNISLTSTSIMYPGISLNAGQVAHLNFGSPTTEDSDTHESDSDSIHAMGFSHPPVLGSQQEQHRLQAVCYGIRDDDTFARVEADLFTEKNSTHLEFEKSDEDEESSDRSSDCHDHGSTAEDGDSADLSLANQPVQLPNAFFHGDDPHCLITSEARPIVEPPRVESHNDNADGNTADNKPFTHGEIGTSTSIHTCELVERLLALGLPRERAIRCATEIDGATSESDAVRWVLNRMDQEGGRQSLDTAHSDDESTSSATAQSLTRSHTTVTQAIDNIAYMSPIIGSDCDVPSVWTTTHDTRQLFLGYQHQGRIPQTHQVRDTNPFVAFEKRYEANASLEGHSLDASVSYQAYVAATQHPLESRSMNLVSMTGMRDHWWAFQKGQESSDNTPHLDGGSCTMDEDVAPVCMILDTLMSTLLCQQIVAVVLFGEMLSVDDVAYSIVLSWATARARNLFQFLRKALQLDTCEVRLVVDEPLDDSQAIRAGMMAYVKFELKSVTSVEEKKDNATISTSFPLYSAIYNELIRQLKRAVAAVRSVKPHSLHLEISVRKIATDSRWSIWLLDILLSSLGDSVDSDPTAPPPESLLWLAKETVLSEAFIGDILYIATHASGIILPWRVAAFGMYKRIAVLHARDNTHFSGTNDTRIDKLPMIHFVELVAVRWKKEKYRQLACSPLTALVWDMLIERLPIYQDNRDASDNQLKALDCKTNIVIETVASTYVAISWEYIADTTGETITRGSTEMSGDEMVDTNGCSDQSKTIESNTLSLSLQLEIDQSIMGTTDGRSDESAAPSSTFIPHVLPRKGSHMLRNLAPDTCYILHMYLTSEADIGDNTRCLDDESGTFPQHQRIKTWLKHLRFTTPPMPRFEFDPDTCGKNLTIQRDNLTVKNHVNKKWNTVRATVGFEDGVHQWHVRIDSCVSKNIFIGIGTAQASQDNYIGSDANGYGFLANKAIWHNKGKLHTYGEIYKQGDVIQVTLDCNAKTLSYSRNGQYLGVAATNLHVSGNTDTTDVGVTQINRSYKWYPAFSLYNKDDQLTLLSPSIPHVDTDGSVSHHASVWGLLHSARIALAHLQAKMTLESNQSVSMHSLSPGVDTLKGMYTTWVRWACGEICWREVGIGDVRELDASDKAAAVFGIMPGDTVFTSRGQCVTLGVNNHELWYEAVESMDMAPSVGPWSLRMCRAILHTPDEYPIHRTIKRSNTESETWHEPVAHEAEPTANGDKDVKVRIDSPENVPFTFERFANIQDEWIQANCDAELISLLDVLSNIRGSDDPFLMSYADIIRAIITHNPLDALFPLISRQIPGSSVVFDRFAVLARICVLLDLNTHIYRVIRFFLHEKRAGPNFTQAVSHTFCEPSREESKPTNPVDVASQLAHHLASAISNDTLYPSNCSGLNRSEIIANFKQYLFASQRERLINFALQQTMTHCGVLSAFDIETKASGILGEDMNDNRIQIPQNMPQFRFQQLLANDVIAFWQTNAAERTAASDSLFLRSVGNGKPKCLFQQLSDQLSAFDPQVYRLQFVPFGEVLPISTTCFIHVENPNPTPIANAIDGKGIPSSPLITLGPSSQYLKFWDIVLTEIQSPMMPLFVPLIPLSGVAPSNVKNEASNYDEPYDDSANDEVILDVNVGLLEHAHTQSCQSQVLLWYFQVGQVLGIAWRSKTLLPLQFVSLEFWRDLVEFPKPLHSTSEKSSTSCARFKLVTAIRDGLCSVVPVECLLLITPDVLRRKLVDTASACLKACKQRDFVGSEPSQEHRALWSVVDSLSCLERQVFYEFVRGSDKRMHKTENGEENESFIEWKQQILTRQRGEGKSSSTHFPVTRRNPSNFLLEIAPALPDAEEHPDACYPVVIAVDEDHSRLHLPNYSSHQMLYKKLLLAMTTLPTSY